MAEGVDFSTARPSAICMYANGKRFCGRYIGPGSSGKHFTKSEVEGYKAVGLATVTLVEGAVLDPLQGRLKGQAHANLALPLARLAGMPSGRPFYFGIDFDMVTSQRAIVADYLKGAASVLGVSQVGVYGGYRTIEWAAANKLASWFFQTYAWSGGKWSTHNHIEQYRNGVTVCGGDTDLCRSKVADYGQWMPGTPSIATTVETPAAVGVDTGWDFTPHIDRIAGDFSDGAGAINQYARALDALS